MKIKLIYFFFVSLLNYVPNVLLCSTCLVLYVLLYLICPGQYGLSRLTCFFTTGSCASRVLCLTALVSHVPRALLTLVLTCFVSYVLLYLFMRSCVSCPTYYHASHIS